VVRDGHQRPAINTPGVVPYSCAIYSAPATLPCVIPRGATRFPLPRRSLARRVAQSRDRGTISPPCNHPLHLASATRHSERRPRSEESLFAFSANLCVLSVSALSFSDAKPRCSKSSRSARPFSAPCSLATFPTALIHEMNSRSYLINTFNALSG